MRTFVRIVESGNLSAAAMQLGTTQPTVSRRLQTLEQQLGAKLILRTTHAMKLTDDGERCYAHARKLIEQWYALEDELGGAGDEPVGILRIRAPHAFGQDQLIGPLMEYLKRYSEMSVDWMLNDRSPDFIAEGIDCAIHVGALTEANMVAILLAEVPRIVVAAPSLIAQYPKVTEVRDLSKLPWVALSTFYRNEVALNHDTEGETYQFGITPKLATDSLYALRNVTLMGLGAAISSSWVVQEDIRQGRLVNLLPQWRAKSLPVYLVYPYASYYPARLRRFMTLIREAMPRVAGALPPGGDWG
jgi:DNA-binding transcriptional LysR family regulator